MPDPAAQAALAEIYRTSDARQKQAVLRALAAVGQRAAIEHLGRIDRQRVAADLLRQGMTSTEAGRVIAERFRLSRATAWRDVKAVSSGLPR